MVKYTFYLTQKQLLELGKIGKSFGNSVSHHIRRAINLYINLPAITALVVDAHFWAGDVVDRVEGEDRWFRVVSSLSYVTFFIHDEWPEGIRERVNERLQSIKKRHGALPLNPHSH